IFLPFIFKDLRGPAPTFPRPVKPRQQQCTARATSPLSDLRVLPTAQISLGDDEPIADRLLRSDTGARTAPKLVPFHSSSTDRPSNPPILPLSPAAQAVPGDVKVTPLSSSSPDDPGLDVATRIQALPSQCRASVVSWFGCASSPTASAFAGD